MRRIALGPVARARNGVIGRDGALPWRLRSDLRLFRETTLGKPVVMGRKTWESLPKRPLPGRLNLVLSRQAGYEAAGAVVCETLDEALAIGLEQAEEDGAAEVCVIGGAQTLDEALPRASRLYLTEVDAEPDGEVTWALPNLADWREIETRTGPAGPGDEHAFSFRVFERAFRSARGPL